MIYGFSRDIATDLQSKLWPVSVYFEGERVTSHGPANMRVEFERDRKASDQVSYVRGSERAPRKVATRFLAVRAYVYVVAPCDGARMIEHHHMCDDLVDALVCSITDWGTATKAGEIAFGESRYLTREELETLTCAEHPAGVVYTFSFLVPRGVRSTDYKGNGPPTAVLTHTTTAVRATIDGVNFESLPD
jgi:hypothetical protein